MPTLTEDTQLGGQAVERIVYSEDQVQTRVDELAQEISAAYSAADRLLVLGLLKGSVLFMSDLVRKIQLPLHMDFMVVSSYGEEKVSSGDVRLLYDPDTSFKGRAVLLVEDIIDSGTTLRRLLPRLRARGPSSIEVCSLLHKRLVTLDPPARWIGFDAPNEFLVGYGLDYAEDFRHLPYIASL